MIGAKRRWPSSVVELGLLLYHNGGFVPTLLTGLMAVGRIKDM